MLPEYISLSAHKNHQHMQLGPIPSQAMYHNTVTHISQNIYPSKL